METKVKKLEIFLARPVGFTKGNFALNRSDVAEFLADVIFLPEGKEKMTNQEDFDGEAEIISTSNFSNGVNATINVSKWVLDAILSRRELRSLKVDDQEYTWRGKWRYLEEVY